MLSFIILVSFNWNCILDLWLTSCDWCRYILVLIEWERPMDSKAKKSWTESCGSSKRADWDSAKVWIIICCWKRVVGTLRTRYWQPSHELMVFLFSKTTPSHHHPILPRPIRPYHFLLEYESLAFLCAGVCLFWAITGYLSRLATCSINSAELRIAQTGLLQQHLWTAVIAKFKMQHQQDQSPLSINTGPWLRSASNNKGNLVEADESKEDEARKKVSF